MEGVQQTHGLSPNRRFPSSGNFTLLLVEWRWRGGIRDAAIVCGRQNIMESDQKKIDGGARAHGDEEGTTPKSDNFLGNVPPTDELLLAQRPTDGQLLGRRPTDRLLLG